MGSPLEARTAVPLVARVVPVESNSAGREVGHRTRILRFLVVGGASAGVDLGLLVGLRELAGMSVPWATTIAFWVALLFNFQLHKTWSFKHRRSTGGPFVRYMVLVAVNYLVTLGIVTGGVAVDVPYVMAKGVAMVVVAVCTYIAYLRWVFR